MVPDTQIKSSVSYTELFPANPPGYASPHKTRKKQPWGLLIMILGVVDMIMTVLAFWLAWDVRQLNATSYQPIFYSALMMLLLPLWLLIFGIVGLYNRRNLLNGMKEYSLVFRAVSVGILIVVFAGFMESNPLLDRRWLLLAWGFNVLLVGSGRFLVRRVVFFLRVRGNLMTPVIIVGANVEGYLLAEQLQQVKRAGFQVAGFVDDFLPVGSDWCGAPILGTIAELNEVLAAYQVKDVIVTTSAFNRAEIAAIFKECGMTGDVDMRLSSGLFEVITTSMEVEEIAFIPFTRINKVRLTGWDELLKAGLDYAITIPLVILGAPFFLLIALAVKLDSKGPVLHRRRVLGINGKPFDAFKFRTMVVDGDAVLAQYPELREELEETQKIKEDPRVTRIGHFLRRYSLDELPQLFNVLRREMSLIGPRMITPEELSRYDQWMVNLLTVRPGISGLWQVSGRSDVSYQDRVTLDMYYVRNWTVGLDLQLIVRTIPALLFGRGAY
jgi:exopolysaccharide biosynthesis polyprenyl glycosylphosphotransferase